MKLKISYNAHVQEKTADDSVRRKAIRWAVFLTVGLLFLGWLLNTPPGLLGKADALGYAVCHRIDVRSFHIGERAMPLCARCSGMFLAAVLGILYQAIRTPKSSVMPGRSTIAVFGLFVLAFGLDGINSYMSLFPGVPTLYEPQNWLRLVTGTGMGLVLAGVLMPAFNQTAWRQPERKASFPNAVTLLPLLALAGLLDILILTENPLFLYPLALISAGGVLLLLTCVYSMVWMLIFKKENLYSTYLQLIMFFAAGFGTAILQIALIDAARFMLTGTWDGFHLG